MLWRSPLLSQGAWMGSSLWDKRRDCSVWLTEHRVTVKDHCCNLICAGLHWESLSQTWQL